MAATTAYLVARRDDGFGEVYPLTAGQRFTLGRSPTNRVVLKDELCSREHAEVYFADGRWHLRDLNSLNGTRVNGERLDSEWELQPNDELHFGHSRLLFVEDMGQLPDMPTAEPSADGVAIKKRLGQTRFLTPLPPPGPPPDGTISEHEHTPPPGQRHNLSRDPALRYRLALDMGSAATYKELVEIVLDGLLEGIPADVGGIMALKEGRELEVIAYRHRDPSVRTYNKVSEFVSNEV